jgi:hypothetical protein
VLDKLREDVLVDNLVALCIGDKDLYRAKRDFKKNCGLTSKEYESAITYPLSDDFVDYIIDEFAIASFKKPKLLKMYIRSELTEWLDAFCYGGTILSLLECAESFHLGDKILCRVHEEIDKLKTTIRTMEIREQIVFEGIVQSSRMSVPQYPKPKVRGFVYFIGAGDFCKIGYTKDIETRLSTLQIGSPTRLELLHVYEPVNVSAMRLEGLLHEHFKYERSSGEWFRISINIEDIEDLCSSLDV